MSREGGNSIGSQLKFLHDILYVSANEQQYMDEYVLDATKHLVDSDSKYQR